MNVAAQIAAIDLKLRSAAISALPPSLTVKMYSRGRQLLLKRLINEVPVPPVPVPPQLGKRCWGLEFRSPIFNAAGMFKNGEGYELCAGQGAGAYLAGTTTWNRRVGNEKNGTRLPFVPYPRSKSASNWLGLPNDGDEVVAGRLKSIARVPGCPIGASLMGSPDFQGQEKLDRIADGIKAYVHCGLDFIEINESCPNTAHGRPQDDDLNARLKFIKETAAGLGRKVPIIVKFSNDTDPAQVTSLMELLVSLGFDGVNFGNTSTAYQTHRPSIAASDQKAFDYFTSTFGGGLSGAPLRQCSLELVKKARATLDSLRPNHEFHIIRTGGVETASDVRASLDAGASLVQWFTGYFEEFSKRGSSLYRHLYEEMAEDASRR